MKSIWCMVWVLAALLAISSIDTRPDPPAVNPHAVDTKSSCAREAVCDFQQERLNCTACFGSPGLPASWNGVLWAYKPKSASDWIALSGHAADPSPPAPPFLCKSSCQS